MTIESIVSMLALFLLGLITGLFYSYSCSINPGLGRLKNAEYLTAMQSINDAILNPIFFMSFIGTVIILPIHTFLSMGNPNFIYILASAVVYAVMVFGVTMIGNVPLNNRLARFKISSASEESIASERADFEKRWNRYHTIRTVSCVISFILLIASLFIA
jgi:uncharacterized membrane protein